MKPLLKLLVTSLTIIIAAYFIPGVKIASFWTAVIVALVMGVINAIIKPIIMFFTLPLNILTLGLFTFIVNGLMILLVAYFVPDFQVNTFMTAVIFSVAVTVINWVLTKLVV
jgi:putative membrane protein